MEELKAKIGDSIDATKADREKKREDAPDKINAFVSDPDSLTKAFDNLDNKLQNMIVEGIDAVDNAVHGLDEKIDESIKKGAEKYDEAAGKVMAAVDSGLEAAEGNYYAAKENARMSQESYESKLNSNRLELQMRLEDAKKKMEDKKTAVDKAAQEELILELLDYADICQDLASSYASEAELAILDARNRDEYEAKYGKFEN